MLLYKTHGIHSFIIYTPISKFCSWYCVFFLSIYDVVRVTTNISTQEPSKVQVKYIRRSPNRVPENSCRRRLLVYYIEYTYLLYTYKIYKSVFQNFDFWISDLIFEIGNLNSRIIKWFFFANIYYNNTGPIIVIFYSYTYFDLL